jgi:hypothetical protein
MFRFTIRDVLWLTVVVALVVLHWLEARQHAAAIHHLKHEVQVRELAAQALANETNILASQDNEFTMELEDNGQIWRWSMKPQ